MLLTSFLLALFLHLPNQLTLLFHLRLLHFLFRIVKPFNVFSSSPSPSDPELTDPKT